MFMCASTTTRAADTHLATDNGLEASGISACNVSDTVSSTVGDGNGSPFYQWRCPLRGSANNTLCSGSTSCFLRLSKFSVFHLPSTMRTRIARCGISDRPYSTILLSKLPLRRLPRTVPAQVQTTTESSSISKWKGTLPIEQPDLRDDAYWTESRDDRSFLAASVGLNGNPVILRGRVVSLSSISLYNDDGTTNTSNTPFNLTTAASGGSTVSATSLYSAAAYCTQADVGAYNMQRIPVNQVIPGGYLFGACYVFTTIRDIQRQCDSLPLCVGYTTYLLTSTTNETIDCDKELPECILLNNGKIQYLKTATAMNRAYCT